MKLLSTLAVAAFLITPALAEDEPAPAGAPALSQILRTVEDNGARTVYSAERERRTWEVVSCLGQSRDCREDEIDIATGALRSSENEDVSRLPPADARPASAIVEQVEKLAIGDVTEIEFDDRRWEVEVRNGARRAEFRIDPMTGETQRCEGTLCP